ncbi:MAG TPA: ABC transporter substrate-binding protein [Candidatus Binatia bacterium]|nr:ABC transporter substrate-binding protein [Candidatus Binatia bacterium]
MSKTGWIAILPLSVSILVSPAARSTFSAERPGKLIPVRIGIVSRSTLDMPYLVARDRGLFREEFLEAEIILVRSSLTVQAMLAGSIDFGTATGTAVNAIVNGVDVRVVLAMSDKPSFDLIAHPSITSVQQLRGKKFGVGGIGGLSDTLVRQILLANQVPPDQVTVLPLGASSLTYTSLKAGVIDAAMLQIPHTFLAQDEGFRKLASGADYYRVVQGGLTTTKTTASERPELVTKAIRATLRAVRLIKNEKKYALEFMKGPYLELGKEGERFTERAYDAAVQGYLLSGVVDEKLQREMITAAAQRIKPQQPVTPERVFDFSFARKAGEALR